MLYDLYAIVEKDRMYVVDKMNIVLGPILNAYKSINLTDNGGTWRRVWRLLEKDGTYIVVGVMVGRGK